jgi:hypothetical protein
MEDADRHGQELEWLLCLKLNVVLMTRSVLKKRMRGFGGITIDSLKVTRCVIYLNAKETN